MEYYILKTHGIITKVNWSQLHLCKYSNTTLLVVYFKFLWVKYLDYYILSYRDYIFLLDVVEILKILFLFLKGKNKTKQVKILQIKKSKNIFTKHYNLLNLFTKNHRGILRVASYVLLLCNKTVLRNQAK